jgi:uncharacterized protein (DUF1800 family)
VGTVRALRIENCDYPSLVVALRNMGQDLFEPPNVKGWDGGRTWLSTNWLLARQNFAVGLVTGSGTGTNSAKFRPKRSASSKMKLDLVELARREKLTTAEEIVSYLSRTLLAAPLTADERAELIATLGELPPAADWAAHSTEVNSRLLRLVALIVSMPEYQLS